jgi:hypothetical protein
MSLEDRVVHALDGEAYDDAALVLLKCLAVCLDQLPPEFRAAAIEALQEGTPH